MLNLEDPQKRAAFETVTKYSFIAIGGIWTLCVGTDFLDRQKASLDLSNAALSVSSIPTASTEIALVEKNLDAGSPYCFVEGTYSIENTGKLPISIQSATIEIYEIENVLLKNDDAVASYSTEVVLKDRAPIHSETFGPPETIGVDNLYQRNFALTVRRRDNHSYLLVANATGGLPELDDDPAELRLIRGFGPNDLRHTAHLGASCPAQLFDAS